MTTRPSDRASSDVAVRMPSVGSREPARMAVSVPRMPSAAGAAMAKRASSSEQRIGRTTMTTASSTVSPIMMARKTLLPGMISSTAAEAAMKLAPATMTAVLAAGQAQPDGRRQADQDRGHDQPDTRPSSSSSAS